MAKNDGMLIADLQSEISLLQPADSKDRDRVAKMQAFLSAHKAGSVTDKDRKAARKLLHASKQSKYRGLVL